MGAAWAVPVIVNNFAALDLFNFFWSNVHA